MIGVALAVLALPAEATPPRIVGYLPQYRTIRPLQFKTLPHAIVFSVVPNPDTGTFKVFRENAQTGEIVFEAPPGGAGLSSLRLDQAVAEAAKYDCQVSLSIGGTAVHSQFQYLVINGKVDVFTNHKKGQARMARS